MPSEKDLLYVDHLEAGILGEGLGQLAHFFSDFQNRPRIKTKNGVVAPAPLLEAHLTKGNDAAQVLSPKGAGPPGAPRPAAPRSA